MGFRIESMFVKRVFAIFIILLFTFLQSCDKKTDSITDAVMAPYGSTVDMGSPVADLTISSPNSGERFAIEDIQVNLTESGRRK